MVNAYLIVQHVIQIKYGIIIHVNVNVKIIVNLEKNIVGVLKHGMTQFIADTLVIDCDKITTAMDIVSTKMTNPIAINATSTASMNHHSKKVRDCYNLHAVLLVIILLFIIIIIFYYVKQKDGHAISI